jgi:hypothetical protein
MFHIIYILFLFSPLISGKEIIIRDGTCFDTYATDLRRITSELTREYRTEYNLQLTAIENMLNIDHPEKGYSMPLSVPVCPVMDPPSNYTIMTYASINKLHMEKLRQSLVNKHVLYRLLMIQRKIAEFPSITTTERSNVMRIEGYNE